MTSNILRITMLYMKKGMVTIRVDESEKKDMQRLAKEEGHNTVSGFIMWLIRQYRDRKLVKR